MITSWRRKNNFFIQRGSFICARHIRSLQQAPPCGFGEFIPFARYFPFLRSITGIEEDFTPA